jgi:hypothetical protein
VTEEIDQMNKKIDKNQASEKLLFRVVELELGLLTLQ